MTQVPSTLVNLRDVASAHPSLAAGVLLRSDAPHADDVHEYDVAWPPRTIVDLRRPEEMSGEHPFTASCTVVNFEVSGRAAYDGEAEEEPVTNLGDMYRRIIEQPRAQAIVNAIEVIAIGETPVLVHCTAGKDRTGVTVAVALLLVGVDRESVIADYALTHDAMPHVFARMQATVRRYTDSEVNVLDYVPEFLRGAPAEAMGDLIDALEDAGGAEAWYLANGGTPETLERLRERLVAQ